MGNSKGILVIPRYQVALRFIELPSIDPSEIESMVEFQALKELPYSKEEIITSFRNIGSYKKGFSYLMLAMIKRQLAEETIARNPEGSEHIRLETELVYLHLLKKGMVNNEKVILVMNFQKDYLEIMIIDRTKPVFSRGLSRSEGWLEEINRSLISYRKNSNNREIEELVIMHESDYDMENIRPQAKAFFAIPVNFYEYKKDLDILSLAAQIDLLPRGYINKALSKENIKQIFLTHFLLVIAIAMLGSLFIFKTHEKNKTILALSKNADKIQKDADQLSTILKNTELLKNHKKEGEYIIGILKEPYKLITQDILLEGLDYDSNDILYCKGMTRDMSSVFNFIRSLEKSKYFKKVEVKQAAKKEIRNQEFTDFSIACFTR